MEVLMCEIDSNLVQDVMWESPGDARDRILRK